MAKPIKWLAYKHEGRPGSVPQNTEKCAWGRGHRAFLGLDGKPGPGKSLLSKTAKWLKTQTVLQRT